MWRCASGSTWCPRVERSTRAGPCYHTQAVHRSDARYPTWHIARCSSNVRLANVCPNDKCPREEPLLRRTILLQCSVTFPAATSDAGSYAEVADLGVLTLYLRSPPVYLPKRHHTLQTWLSAAISCWPSCFHPWVTRPPTLPPDPLSTKLPYLLS